MLPHCNIKNVSPIPRVACFVSLYPKSYLNANLPKPYTLFDGDEKKARKLYKGTMEREFFADVWQERVAYTKTPLVRKALGMKKLLGSEFLQKNRKY